jgi:flagellar biosynthesis protein FlhB
MEQATSSMVAKIHQIYGGHFLLALLIGVILTVLIVGPKPTLQRVTAVLVDINIVIGLVAFFQTARPVSWFHPILALGAVGLLHASAKSEDKAKVVRCFSIALILLVAAWAVNAAWGPEWFKTNFVKLPAAIAK